MPHLKPKSTRRVASLQDKDYDHEISLVDNAPELEDVDGNGAEDEAAEAVGVNVPTLEVAVTDTDGAGGAAAAADDDADAGAQDPSRRPSQLSDAASTTPLLPSTAAAGPRSRSSSTASARGRQPQRAIAPLDKGPSVRIQCATPGATPNEPNHAAAAGSSAPAKARPSVDVLQVPISQQPTRQSMQSVRVEPEEALDVLYENERGLFLCGIPLFSRQALGNLDPSPWTNSANRTSPTDIYTAQVPDPTWEWAWPEWRINHDEGTDEDGWQYSFMFARAFSWHGPSWYRSFVRRRVWIRKRVRRTTSASVSAAASALGLGQIDSIKDPNLLSPDYFTVVSAASMRRSASRASSRRDSRLSLSLAPVGEQTTCQLAGGSGSGSGGGGGVDSGNDSESGNGNGNGENNNNDDADDADATPSTIDDINALMRYLRTARIDREKVEAVSNYLANAGDDLVRLQDCMHEIMALFVFQASRRALLTLLITAHDQAQKAGADAGLGRRAEYLTAAVKHADEEVRRLEYWSDVKAMAQQGSAAGAVDKADGWDAAEWQGVDQSGPAPPSTKAGDGA